jgi:hypothetical protein
LDLHQHGFRPKLLRLGCLLVSARVQKLLRCLDDLQAQRALTDTNQLKLCALDFNYFSLLENGALQASFRLDNVLSFLKDLGEPL